MKELKKELRLLIASQFLAWAFKIAPPSVLKDSLAKAVKEAFTKEFINKLNKNDR